MNRFQITRYPLNGKTVLVRTDLDVPLEKGKITDNRRILESLNTIKFLLKNNCKIVLAGHLGRPEGRIVTELSLKPIGHELKKLLPGTKLTIFKDSIGKEIKEKIAGAMPKEIFLLENLRYYLEEEQNDSAFAHSLAHLADVYVNDCFSTSHRKHASLVGITKYLPSMAGLTVEKEILNLSKALIPKRPAVWLLGGSKLDKVDLISNALDKADYILIGGALAFSFLKAKKIPVGSSLISRESVKAASKILKKTSARKIILPKDFLVADSFSNKAKSSIVQYNEIKPYQIGLDLGPETLELFKHYLKKAHTIVWNGPLGYFEWAKFAQSTKELGRFIGKLTAISICGGGETAEALQKFHLEHNLSHLSTAGGAAVQFLSGKPLIAIKALEDNYKQFKKRIELTK